MGSVLINLLTLNILFVSASNDTNINDVNQIWPPIDCTNCYNLKWHSIIVK